MTLEEDMFRIVLCRTIEDIIANCPKPKDDNLEVERVSCEYDAKQKS